MAKIESLSEEIKQGLESKHIRIEAPVPGTKFVGIEVPRSERVYLPLELKDIPQNGFNLPIGKGIDGQTRFVNLAEPSNPHIMVVGATGSGKSETLKVMVKSVE